MGPHAKHLNRVLFLEDMIDKPMLNIDTAGVCALQVAKKFFERRRPLEGIVRENCKKLFSFGSQARRCQPPGILLSLLREDNPPGFHQPGCF